MTISCRCLRGQWHQNCYVIENCTMEKRILGVVLSILGIIGLVLAAIRFTRGIAGGEGARLTIIALILGAVFFFSGIGLVKSTKDKAT